MRYRIAGFNDHGEVRILNERDEQVAVGELRIETITEPEQGDVLGIELHVVWDKQSNTDVYEAAEIDWDKFPR